MTGGKRKESEMPSGFDKNVAADMPRSGKGAEPKTPWDVTSPSGKGSGRHGAAGVAGRGRYPSLERGKSDVLEKIRDLKAELEASFTAREEVQGKLEEATREIGDLKTKQEVLQEKLAEHQRDAAFQKDEKEAAQKKIKEMEDLLERERAAKDELQAELAEARMALDEINAALE